jgi:hypothetical protein
MIANLTSKKTALTFLIPVAAIVMTMEVQIALAQTPAKPAPSATTSPAATQPAQPKSVKEAILSVQKSAKYLFVVFYDQKDDLFKDMEKTILTLTAKSKDKKILVYQASVNDKSQADAVAKYGVGRAKLPLVLIFAPNGAITGGFPQKVTEQQLAKSMVSESVAKIVKVVQEQKLALVLLQNNKTKFNQESAQAAKDFSNDTKVKSIVEIIKNDPEDTGLKSFLAQCDLTKPITESTIVLVAPRGTIVGVFSGNVTKDTLLEALAPKTSGCCPGGSGGCK